MSIFDIKPEDNVTREYLIEKGFFELFDEQIYIYYDLKGVASYRFDTETLNLVVRDNQILMSGLFRSLGVRSTWKRESYKSKTLLCSHHITDRGLFDMLFSDFEKITNYLRKVF